MPSLPTPAWFQPVPRSGDLSSVPPRICPPSAAVELLMSKKSALTPATAPALLADSVSGPPAETAPFHSESDLTAGLARSTDRIWWSYHPV
jgi:hypothetical protein